jgi:prepilin-type N-terminal cleavage/methylation domain-containing protein
MTLVELMIVVVILGILASLGMVGYRRYVGRARATEAVAMLAEITAKEQVYFTEFGGFMTLTSSTSAVVALSSAGNAFAGETAGNFYPRDPTGAGFDSVRSAATATALPLSWQYVAVRPKDTVLYCSYMAGAGVPTSKPPSDTTGTVGANLMGTAAIAAPWFYALGACNLKGTGAQTYPAQVTVFAASYNSPSLTVINDGQ